jgi:hypothetical protein
LTKIWNDCEKSICQWKHTPRINGNPRKNAFSTEGLEEWQIDQMMEEVFGESESGFEAAGLSKEEQDAYWQRKENRDKNRKSSEPSSDRPAPARPNPFSTEGLEEWQIDQMVEEVFGESESGFEAAGLSKEDQDAYWQRKENRDKNRKNSKTPSNRPAPARPNPFSTEGLEEWQIDQMVEEIFGESESGLEAAGLSKEEQDAYWQRNGGKPGANLAGAPEGNADPAAELPGEEVLALTEAAEGMLSGEKTVEELYAEDPSRFMKWMRYLGYSFGHGLAVFYEAAMDGVDWLLGSPWRVFGGENRVTKWLEESGDQSLEFYQQRMDAAVAAMGDSAGWSKGAQVMSGFSTAFEMFLTVGIGASLIGKLTAGTAAAPLRNYKIPKGMPETIPSSSVPKITSEEDLNRYFTESTKFGEMTPEQLYQELKKSGFSPKPLGRGSWENVPFENGGGYRIHWGGDRILQYHPGGFNHHGDQPYFKLSSGPTGTLWFDLFGNPI